MMRPVSGSENIFPMTGKYLMPTSVSSKKSVTVYIDKVEERSENDFIAAEEVEYSMCETEASTIKSNLHLLLNLSTGNKSLI